MGSDVNLIFRLAGLAIAVSAIYALLKQVGREDYAFMTVLAGLSVGLLWVIPVIITLFDTVRSVFQLY